MCLSREGPLIFASLLDEFRCGHFAVMWSFSLWSSEVWSTESSFFAIIPATLLFCAKLAVTDLLPAIDTKTGTSVYISFHSAHEQVFELSISEHQDSSKKSSIQKCESPFNGCDPTVLFITDAASYNRRSCQLKRRFCGCSHTCTFAVCWYV